MSTPLASQAANFAVDVWTEQLGKQEHEKALTPLTFHDVWWIYERIEEEEKAKIKEEKAAEKAAEIVVEKQKMDALSAPHAHAAPMHHARQSYLDASHADAFWLLLSRTRALVPPSPCLAIAL